MDFKDQQLKIALTGGSGFLGSHLLKMRAFHNALAIGRNKPINHQYFKKANFEIDDNLFEILNNKDVVVHLAARVHIMNESASNPLDEFRRVNTVGTLNIANQAGKAGVKRFIYISSIKVLGESTKLNQPFTSKDSFNPQDAYSKSKAEAEEGIKNIGKKYGMEIVIIRPPLIYGKGVKGNFASLQKLARLPIPMPIGLIKNKRSLVSVENLVDLIITCLDHKNAKNQTFLVSDDCDLSTPELYSMLCKAGGYNSYIFKFPISILKILFRLSGKLAFYDRLSGSMQINIDYTKSILEWRPPFNIENSLQNCWLLDNRHKKSY